MLHSHEKQPSGFEYKYFKPVFFQAIILLGFILVATSLSSADSLLTLLLVLDLRQNMPLLFGIHTSTDVAQALTQLLYFLLNHVPSNYSNALYQLKCNVLSVRKLHYDALLLINVYINQTFVITFR
jgi:hypothetical protein